MFTAGRLSPASLRAHALVVNGTETYPSDVRNSVTGRFRMLRFESRVFACPRCSRCVSLLAAALRPTDRAGELGRSLELTQMHLAQ